MTQEEINRSGALSPEMSGMINTAIAASVSEAVKAVMLGLMPMMKEMQLTPEKLDALRTPKQSEADLKRVARELRESLKSKKDEAEILRLAQERKDACTHTYKNGQSAINLVHNFHDRQPRGTCVICADWIHPREWRIGPPTETEPNGHAFCVPAHKDYARVITQENNS